MTRRASGARGGPRANQSRVLADVLRAAPPVPFGPAFFLTQLAAFLRDRCPSPLEGLPSVTLVLAGGDTIDVCHVEGLSAHWLAIAAFDERAAAPGTMMQSIIVPYEAIARITVRVVPADASIGFRAAPAPRIVREPGEHGESAPAAHPGGRGGGSGPLPPRRATSREGGNQGRTRTGGTS